MSDLLGLAIAVLTLLTLMLSLIGLAVRFVLVPYLKEHLIKPVKSVEQQVTVNKHVTRPPTMLDKIDTVQREVASMARMFEGHMQWSEQWVRAIEEQIEGLTRGDEGRSGP